MREETAAELLKKVREDYDAIAADFSATRTAVWPEMERVHEFIRPGDRVLDVGCGNGRAYQLFSGKAIEYVGLDVSAGLIAQARSLRRDLLADFRVGSALKLPFEAGEFDSVLAVAMLQHVPSEKLRLQALGEMRRVLKPGGRLFMTNWRLWRPGFVLSHLGQLAGRAVAKILGRTDLDLNDLFIPWKRGPAKADRYYHAFTGRELKRLCRVVGFELVGQDIASRGRDHQNFVTICRKKN